ncbi:ABC transporter substrate-binding protein [Streptomyces melanosporofaciens]|uniref:Peptide/nickel transport system substrate-binding protein n=1 Tax=Streptomyces melanosporofaciens TaxID=67327 RepID=A0A1H4VZP1_STRMJ|nr:ABC transporter substrate-binding protein [Streptomyces melanosporofaciens]SEC85734.1 peptide/nickel transport system substrate-binding protein [Streptomyces melanosporofaciens]
MRTKLCTTAVGLAGALLFTAGCSGAASGSGGATVNPAKLKLTDTTPKATGAATTVNWLVEQEPASLDMDAQGGSSTRTVMANICERLLLLRPDMTTTPRLAKKAEYTGDKKLVLTLRDDVTFHDGAKMTADDVVWSLKRHARPEMNESDEYEDVDTIAKTGPSEVTITFKKPSALFTKALAGDAGIIMERKAVEKQGDDFGTPGHPDACTGPYKLKSWDSGSALTIERYADYWDGSVRPLTKEVVFRWASGSALVNSISTGAADGAYLTATGPAAVLSEKKGIRAYYGQSTTAWSLSPTKSGALKDARLRKALSLAMDRKGIAKSGFNGLAEPWATPVGPGAWGYEKAAFQKAQKDLEHNGAYTASPSSGDIARAKKLVERAGAPGEPIVVSSDGSESQTVITNAVRGAAQKIGLKVTVKTIASSRYDEFFSDPKSRDGFDLIPVDWYISKADPAGFYDNGITGNANNWLGYSDKGYDALVGKAQQTIDDRERAKLVIDAQAKFADDAVWIPLVQVPSVMVLGDKYTGPPASMVSMYYPWAADLGTKKG